MSIFNLTTTHVFAICKSFLIIFVYQYSLQMFMLLRCLLIPLDGLCLTSVRYCIQHLQNWITMSLCKYDHVSLLPVTSQVKYCSLCAMHQLICYCNPYSSSLYCFDHNIIQNSLSISLCQLIKEWKIFYKEILLL